VAFMDIPNAIAKGAVEYFKKQGIYTMMITGDSYLTGEAVGKIVGIDEVRANVMPEDKAQIIKSQKEKYGNVAMLGDGVNDVLALKKADISFAMNGATSAAKSVSNIVFLTDDFDVFYDILMEGRRVINNIQKVASLFLTKTFFSITFSILSVIFALEFAFIPIQFTIISAITIGIPSFFLTFESNKDKVSDHFMRDILTNAVIGGGVLVLSVLLTNFVIHNPAQVKFICFLLALINGLLMVTKVSLPFNKYKAVLLVALTFAAVVGIFANIFILKNHFNPLTIGQITYVALVAIVIAVIHYVTRRKRLV